MSLPKEIFAPNVPIGAVQPNGDVLMNSNWWLLIYNIVLNSIGTEGSISPAGLIQLAGLDSDASDTDATSLRDPISSLAVQSASLADGEVDAFALRQQVSNALVLAQDAGDFVQQFGNPTASVGLSAVNGTSMISMRADGAPALSQAITPTWTNTHTFSNTPVVPDASWVYAKIQQVSATSRVLGRITAGAGVIEELTAANLATIIGTALGANPSASVGLSAVNGSAGTYMRSDAAPALDQTIVPTWTGKHIFNGAVNTGTGTSGVSVGQGSNHATVTLCDTNGAANAKLYRFITAATTYTEALVNDAFSTLANFRVITRSGVAVTDVSHGNATDNPTHQFLGTGAATFSGDVKVGTVGKGIYVKEGTNATMGVATLVAGTIVVSTTKVTANSRIFLTVQALGTVAVATPVAVTARTAGTSFTITSSAITDTSVIAWWIAEPA